MLLSLNNISKSFDDKAIVSNISLQLEAGQSIALRAPSGRGKSTLLSIAGLLLEPTEGSVEVCGTNFTGAPEIQRAHCRANDIGFVFQHTQLLGSLRAIENVLVGATFIDKSAKTGDLQKRAEELLRTLQLEDRMYHYPSQLSVGQKRRVAVARALLANPRVIIADEPTNDLDAECVTLVTEMLFSSVKAGDACLLVATHDEDFAKQADKEFTID